ncbi:PilN domain-containing protein [Xanthobacter dioxanivorans]|uniref:PilN domain-containing protein n=1 Tax=Xanthobacter dioxanivorans TaxID=2528964 RepID=A0A974SJR3_9HYPH|nr:PilN domain-containing protein [Xanthobacter dioxanivorans]QRG08065.1 PilN domain-containing protein [Xanthobacter dioxanivorans]
MTRTGARPPAPAILDRALDAFSRWIDTVAGVVAAVLAGLRPLRAVRIGESAAGMFSLAGPDGGATGFPLAGPPDAPSPEVAARVKGRAVELALDPARFLSRPLELPAGAAPFLDGIVRAQIDRLTPWTAGEAVYGWTPPVMMPDERLRLTVLAAPRARVEPPLHCLRTMGAGSVAVTVAAVGGAGPVLLRGLDPAMAGVSGLARVRRALLAVLAAAAVLATLALAASEIAGGGLDAERDDIDARIAAHRRALTAGGAAQGAGGAALRALEQRKRESQPTVLVLEALSRVLPDDTHVTAWQMDGDRVQVAGISREAPALVRLMEQSRAFTQATFVAPTTRQPGEAGERFEIEARIAVPPEGAR